MRKACGTSSTPVLGILSSLTFLLIRFSRPITSPISWVRRSTKMLTSLDSCNFTSLECPKLHVQGKSQLTPKTLLAMRTTTHLGLCKPVTLLPHKCHGELSLHPVILISNPPPLQAILENTMAMVSIKEYLHRTQPLISTNRWSHKWGMRVSLIPRRFQLTLPLQFTIPR